MPHSLQRGPSMYHHNKPAPLIRGRKVLRILLFAIVTFTLCISPLKTQNLKLNTGTAYAQDRPASAVWITPRGGKPFFVIGANYEGPTDRAWLMWEDGKFDRQMIADD